MLVEHASFGDVLRILAILVVINLLVVVVVFPRLGSGSACGSVLLTVAVFAWLFCNFVYILVTPRVGRNLLLAVVVLFLLLVAVCPRAPPPKVTVSVFVGFRVIVLLVCALLCCFSAGDIFFWIVVFCSRLYPVFLGGAGEALVVLSVALEKNAENVKDYIPRLRISMKGVSHL